MMKPSGWKYESARHALAARGIPTGRAYMAFRSGPIRDSGGDRQRKERAGEWLRRWKDTSVFEKGSILAPRDEVESLIMNSTRGSMRGAMQLLKYRNMYRDAPEVQAQVKEMLQEMKAVQAKLEGAVSPSSKKLLGERVKELENSILERTGIAPAQVPMYKNLVQKAIISSQNKMRARSALEKDAKESIRVAAESAEGDLESKELKDLSAPKGLSPLFKKIDQNVAADVIKPGEAAEIKQELKLTPVPKALQLNQIAVTKPMFADVDEKIASGKMTVSEGIEAKKAYLKGVRKLLETKQSRVQFDTDVELPTGKSEPPKSALKRIGKQYTDLEWFARKRRPWLFV